MLRENKWRAARYGLDADIVVDEKGTVRPVRQAILDLVEDLTPTAKRLGCEAELRDVERVLAVGASYQRQRAVAAAHDGDLEPVVDSLLAEMRDGLPAAAGGPAGRARRWREGRGMTPVVEKLGAAVDDWVAAHHAAAGRHPPAPARPPGAGLRRVRDDVLPRAAAARAHGLKPRRLPTGTGLVVRGRVAATRSSCCGPTSTRCPLADLKDVPYASTREGLCHACGHDVHTTVVLGVAHGAGHARRAARHRALRLPAGRGDGARRRHRGGRRRRARRRHPGLRAALRPVGAGGKIGLRTGADHRRLRPHRRHAAPAPAGTPPGRS